VTQQFDTTTSMGQLMLNILISFAQFERETIAERTRDKMAAARRRGIWTGGHLVLGYDLKNKKMVKNREEAEKVRAIFKLYLLHGSFLKVAEELSLMGWKTKSRARNGKSVSGKAFDKDVVKRILTNPIYLGKVRYGGDIYEGAHEAIVDRRTWDSVQRLIRSKGKHCRRRHRITHGALLHGLLRCGVCGSAMTTHSSRKGARRFRYYVCLTYQKRGARACPGSRAALADLDATVLEQVLEVGKDPGILKETFKRARQKHKRRRPELLAQKGELEGRETELQAKRRNLLEVIAKSGASSSGLLTASRGVLKMSRWRSPL